MAKLARLSIAEEQLQSVAADMEAILEFMGEISAWEGAPAPRAPATPRREDRPHETDGRRLVRIAHEVEAGDVIVPPIKGSS